MSFKLLTVVVLLSFVCVAFCALAHGPPSTNQDYPGKCWHTETKKAYAPGDVFTDRACTRVNCNSDFSFGYATCGAIGAPPPCRVVDGDLSLPYPDCCPKIKCGDN